MEDNMLLQNTLYAICKERSKTDVEFEIKLEVYEVLCSRTNRKDPNEILHKMGIVWPRIVNGGTGQLLSEGKQAITETSCWWLVRILDKSYIHFKCIFWSYSIFTM